MKNMNKILAVSILAITAVSSANAKIVSESLLTSTPGTYTSTNTVQAAIADAKKAGTDAAALASGKVSSVGTGSENGTISVNGSDVAVKGLKSAAYTESSAYATAAQGTLATNAVPKTTTVNGHALSSNVTVTKGDVGLGNVDNTSDANKPISTATQTALNNKENSSNKVASGSEKLDDANQTGWNDYYPSLSATQDMIDNTLNSFGGNVVKVNGTASDMGLIGRDKDGAAGKVGTLTDLTYTSSASGSRVLAVDKATTVASGNTKPVTSGAVYNAIGALDVAASAATGDGHVVTSVSETDGKIAVTKTAGVITDADISDSAAIAPSKIATSSSARFVTDTEKTGWTSKVGSVATGSADGTISVDGSDVSVKGLKSGAYNDAYSLPTASSSTLGGVKIGSNVGISSGTISVANASTSGKGVIQIASDSDVSTGTDTGKAVTPAQLAKKQDSQIGAAKVSGADSTDKNKAVIVGADGKMTLSSSALASGAYSAAYSLPTASSSTLGGVKIGSNIGISSGTISVADASTSAKGVMQVGTDLSVSSGTVSVDKATTVASGNTKPVTSGAVYNAINNYKVKENDERLDDSNQTGWDDYYPTLSGAQQMIDSTLSSFGGNVVKVSGTASDMGLIGRDKDGTAGKVTVSSDLSYASTASGNRALGVNKSGSVASGNTGIVTGGTVYTEVRPSATNTQEQGSGYLQNQAVKSNLTALDTALKSIHPNTGEVKIPSGCEKATSYASIWIE